MITVLGIDTGDTAGFCLAAWEPSAHWRKTVLARAFQCDAGAAGLLLDWILSEMAAAQRGWQVTAVQIEAFDDRPRGHGLAGTSPDGIRTQVNDLRAACRSRNVPVTVRQVSDVKRWATDERLAKAGLLEVTAGMPRHARDAARHALFTAVHDCGLPDPMSRRAGREPRDVPG